MYKIYCFFYYYLLIFTSDAIVDAGCSVSTHSALAKIERSLFSCDKAASTVCSLKTIKNIATKDWSDKHIFGFSENYFKNLEQSCRQVEFESKLKNDFNGKIKKFILEQSTDTADLFAKFLDEIGLLRH
ncbi:hypothetical protein BpHYR1_004235 [Brachionus plicatilis]|uniref:Uncharacterized protein n=1 Tax=Brachionus plicatilis TaxID=10195 RepID=A0A3M7Q0D6_BRAPC|nr:hypothetical protein BpHYR1_004235 [Brachionus plicatilis]